MGLFSKAKNPGWLAIGQRDGAIDLAHVSRPAAGRPVLHHCDAHQLEGEFHDALVRLRATISLQRHRCATLLRHGEYRLVHVEAPDVAEPELREALRWRVKDLLDFPVETATLDAMPLPVRGEARSRHAFVAAAPDAIVKARMDAFEAAGAPVEAIDIPELAQRNVAALFEQPNRGLGVLAFDESGGLVTFTADGELYAFRRIDIGGVELASASAERRTELVERVALELQRSLDGLERTYSATAVSRILVAEPDGTSLAASLAGNLYVPVEPLDLASVLDLESVPEFKNPGRAARMLPVIGTALRHEEAPRA
jgi:MSHA biogenesis protein MshI